MEEFIVKFLKNNKALINENTKESWEKIYSRLPKNITGEFTKIILNSRINDPASIMGYVPTYYFDELNIREYIIPRQCKSDWGFRVRLLP